MASVSGQPLCARRSITRALKSLESQSAKSRTDVPEGHFFRDGLLHRLRERSFEGQIALGNLRTPRVEGRNHPLPIDDRRGELFASIRSGDIGRLVGELLADSLAQSEDGDETEARELIKIWRR